MVAPLCPGSPTLDSSQALQTPGSLGVVECHLSHHGSLDLDINCFHVGEGLGELRAHGGRGSFLEAMRGRRAGGRTRALQGWPAPPGLPWALTQSSQNLHLTLACMCGRVGGSCGQPARALWPWIQKPVPVHGVPVTRGLGCVPQSSHQLPDQGGAAPAWVAEGLSSVTPGAQDCTSGGGSRC